MTSPGAGMDLGSDAGDRFADYPERAARAGNTAAPSRLTLLLEAERVRWFYWAPVALGAGIAFYFSLPFEPRPLAALLALMFSFALSFAFSGATIATVLTRALLLASTGFALITLRAMVVAAPILAQPTGAVDLKGYIEQIEPRDGPGVRLTLQVREIGNLAESERPGRVRVRVTARRDDFAPGDAVMLRARLAPPGAPVLPGGFDFARHAYFEGLGAVGYGVSRPVLDPDAGPPPLSLRIGAWFQRARAAIGARVDRVLGGESAAISKALLTGERGGISEATNRAYRDSGLFHILSISGLHMAIMGGAVFASVRLLLALFPSIALRYPVKKWAALAAAAGSLAYLAISGTSFATVRSFIMISIMFGAILLNRPAIALRNVALSALVILILFPESLLDVGFQMSFAAVVALVAAYEGVRDHYAGQHARDFGLLMKVVLFFGGIVLSTLVASAAVTPLAIYHFHKTQQYAVLANLVAVPICNIVVMPAALAAFVMMPFGLDAAPLLLMGLGVDAMSETARWVAGLPGAVGVLPAIPTAAFGGLILGGLWMLLWHGRWRFFGLAAIAGGLAMAPLKARPDLLVGRDGQLVAVRAPDGHLAALPAPQSKFELTRWLESDGDSRSAADVVGTPGLTCDALGCTGRVNGAIIAISRHPAGIADDCRTADLVILDVPSPVACSRPAAVIDFFATRTAGTHAVYIAGPRQVRTETVAEARGQRPWSPPHPWTAEGQTRNHQETASASDGGPMPLHGSSERRRGHSAQAGYGSRISQFAAPAGLLDGGRMPRPDVEEEDPPNPGGAAD